MPDWFETMAPDLWLKPDETGVDDALFIKRALRLRKGQEVLDAPCGAGRIAFPLAELGIRVTGIDLRGRFLRRARNRFREAGLDAVFQKTDLRAVEFEGGFGGVFNWGGSFGYFSEAENLDVLMRYGRALRRRGKLLIDQPNRERILRHFVARRRMGVLTTRTSWDAVRKRVVSHRTRNGCQDSRDTSSIRLYTLGEMKRLLERAGLKFERAYGGPTGEEYRPSARRLIVVAQRL